MSGKKRRDEEHKENKGQMRNIKKTNDRKKSNFYQDVDDQF